MKKESLKNFLLDNKKVRVENRKKEIEKIIKVRENLEEIKGKRKERERWGKRRTGGRLKMKLNGEGRVKSKIDDEMGNRKEMKKKKKMERNKRKRKILRNR